MSYTNLLSHYNGDSNELLKEAYYRGMEKLTFQELGHCDFIVEHDGVQTSLIEKYGGYDPSKNDEHMGNVFTAIATGLKSMSLNPSTMPDEIEKMVLDLYKQ